MDDVTKPTDELGTDVEQMFELIAVYDDGTEAVLGSYSARYKANDARRLWMPDADAPEPVELCVRRDDADGLDVADDDRANDGIDCDDGVDRGDGIATDGGRDVDGATELATPDFTHGWPGVVAYTHDGAMYCPECAEADDRIDTSAESDAAVLRDSETDVRNYCNTCGIGIDEMLIGGDTCEIDRGDGIETDGGRELPCDWERMKGTNVRNLKFGNEDKRLTAWVFCLEPDPDDPREYPEGFDFRPCIDADREDFVEYPGETFQHADDALDRLYEYMWRHTADRRDRDVVEGNAAIDAGDGYQSVDFTTDEPSAVVGLLTGTLKQMDGDAVHIVTTSGEKAVTRAHTERGGKLVLDYADGSHTTVDPASILSVERPPAASQ